MSELMTVARPYAKAAFDFALENATVDKWQEMLVFSSEVAKNSDIRTVLASALAPEKLADLFNGICDEQLDTHGQNFISVLAENNRLSALPDISSQFNILKQEHDKEIDVEITSAIELSEEQLEKMSAALEKRLARKVKLNCNVNPGLVAGVIIKAGDTVIDGSVNSKLNRLSDALQA